MKGCTPERQGSARALRVRRLLRPLCPEGMVAGAVFFAFSLTPSLLPRSYAVQGLLSGLSFAAGYGVGVAGVLLWRYLQLPRARTRVRRVLRTIAAAATALLCLASLWHAAHWQNSIRRLLGMEELSGFQPVLLVLIGALLFVLVLGLARLFAWVWRRLSSRLGRYVPARLARLLAAGLSVFVFWTTLNGLFYRFLLKAADRSFQALDALIDDELPRPAGPEQTGSSASRIAWEDLGRQGREFVARGPSAADLSAFFGRPVTAPIRVYVGLNSADNPEARAQLALEELIRAGGFQRSLLLLVTPTGTGWVDPASQATVEYLHRGDLATVAAQYSYLSSPLALLTQGDYGAEMARALFARIYGHWRSLPKDSRPRLFLHGLSLGSLNSDLSFDVFDVVEDPFDGALWSGPPYRHGTWRRATRERDPGSPAWLPIFRGGSVVRFMNQTTGLREGTGTWGNFRIAFLQYASDPITFFDPKSAWRMPDWMREPRGPDVSPALRWFPVVTMLQLATDMMAGTAPKGFGHEYAPLHYIDAWLAVTEPEGWTDAELQRLRALFHENEPRAGGR
ncbi:MAG: alpha/beta-hydrolase family protein [Verrucomicrobiae bacterium]|nr:alpha/beta-hydrolase family protein [Verrucomicrobiae bacterium]